MSDCIFEMFSMSDSPTWTHWYATTGHYILKLIKKINDTEKVNSLGQARPWSLNVAQASDRAMLRCTIVHNSYISFSECASTDTKWKVITS